MVYTVQSWTDGAGGGTPISAARLTHIEAGLSDHETRVGTLEADSGWVAVTVAGTYTANGPPQVRKIGRRVQGSGGITNAALAINTSYTAVMTIPTGYRPDRDVYAAGASSLGAATSLLIIKADGTVELRTGGTLGTYYRMDAITWWAA